MHRSKWRCSMDYGRGWSTTYLVPKSSTSRQVSLIIILKPIDSFYKFSKITIIMCHIYDSELLLDASSLVLSTEASFIPITFHDLENNLCL